ncbi:UDP-N-acetylmuramoyl-L-alanyl-D-glutamate--2,6-diaminopimelate ligase [Hydrogenophaga palleronii]|uniref:UDP-N-acetylmuramoyl-L-alanyl-D-glutamate--2,6-diaminopimelate ligase n=1 Tax=Hydrogenophaga palleronii TaxID=65655 RepID=A0ABU1WLM3_9BURK|nr:UDP-N-acetylmuramoyl-L-alanyl-D-glutamate--2,6-diaminopimelate ligase [Hydrogenophaga palleronii]MDR7150195.1 UDP-N-acetylmuramoyl-L-alanyl-D-glutamate--2,6-diaminopimelate ligase [Hydrogenophaga palleronii]
MQSFDTPQFVTQWLHDRVQGALSCDSRQIRPGDGFVAWPGAAQDGRQFVRAALDAGASAVVVERDGVAAFDLDDQAPIAAVAGLKALAGPIASAFCQMPSAQLDVIAITGTNGKTSSAWWMAQLLSACGHDCAMVGTLGMGRVPTTVDDAGSAALVSTGLTTPDPMRLQQQLREFVSEGVKACAIEASSIGLVEGRLNGTQIKVAVFTNFTQDHLDFHGDMPSYWAAKAMLFDWPGLAAAVVNLDDVRGSELAVTLGQRSLDLWTIAVGSGPVADTARLFARDLVHTRHGMQWEVVERDVSGNEIAAHQLSLPVVGEYNVSNLLGVLASARALGVPLARAVAACAVLSPVPGRMQPVAPDGDASLLPWVLVDYAHTPDALEKALQALQPVVQQRNGALWVVIGCGGDRDRSKRPLMAAVAEREAQHAVLTSDNPRSENPERILRDMAAGLSRPQDASLLVDRSQAIAHAVAQARPQDVVLVAGKGHEDYQDVQGVKRPFSDVSHARLALNDRLRCIEGSQA